MTDGPINKTMDRADLHRPDARAVISDLDRLVEELRERDLAASSWYGEFDLADDPHSFERVNRGHDYRPLPDAADDENFPWFLYWEIAWLVINNDLRPGQRLLDLGGSSSLFAYYVASKGLQVTTIDLRPELVENSNRVAAEMGWALESKVMDIRAMELDGSWDHITSVCVYEHIPISARLEINRRIADMLADDGSFSITCDYLNPSRHARISSPEDLREQFVDPSGLRLRGNAAFHDNGERYLLHPFHHPLAWRKRWKTWCVRQGEFRPWEMLRSKRENEYTFAALFMAK